MKAGAARSAASDWVARHARPDPDFRGAFISGSTISLPDEAELSPASDVDIVVVTAGDEPRPKLGKLRHRDALLEVTYLPWALFTPAQRVLASYHLAGSFQVDTIIEDPTGYLRRLHARVAREFADPSWVRRRCAEAERRIVDGLATIDRQAPFHQQVTGWLFATGVTTHLVLIAALRNPTVRLRYAAAREVLLDHGLGDRYAEFLELLGCAGLTRGRVEHQLRELARTFDATAAVAKTPFFFSTDISALARPIAIAGSQELIDRGLHREAVFWIIATFARCHAILAVDAPRLHDTLAPAFRSAVADLGITSPEDIPRRAGRVNRFLPRLRETVEEILAGRSAGNAGRPS